VILTLISIAQSIVLVAASIQGGAKTGTGFAISSTPTTTRILTAAHVVEGSTAPLVFIGGPRGKSYTATIVKSDRLRDVALLEIASGNMPTLAFADDAPPTSGTDIMVDGYPTVLEGAPSASPPPSPSPLPLVDLRMIPLDGKVDGVAEEGESVLMDIPVTHGDSGAPIVDATSGKVVGMVLGLAAGYGVAHWMSGDGLGLSVAAIDAFLNQKSPAAGASPPPKPAYTIAMIPNTNADVSGSWSQLSSSAGFTVTASGRSQNCRTSPAGPPDANAVIDEEGDTQTLSIEVTDCSGAAFYSDGLTVTLGGVHNLVRLIGRTFLGYIDTHPAQWDSLLKFGIAVDPKTNPYLALMSVDRNPFGQLFVANVFHGGPADRAGLKPNDAIVKIDGRPTRALADPFIARLLDQPSVTLLVDRNEQLITARIELERFSALTAAGPVPH
jgi:S1-C subfamily serine protease